MPNNCPFQVSDSTGAADNMDKVIVKSEDGDVFEVSLHGVDHRAVNDKTINCKVESVELIETSSFSGVLNYDNKPEDCKIETTQPLGISSHVSCLENVNHIMEETNNSLNQHTGSIHRTSAKAYVCPEQDCRKVFKTKRFVKRHRSVHINRNTVVCPMDGCNKRFQTNSYLNQHKARIHRTSTKAVICPVDGCNKRFETNSYLKQHKTRIHSTSAKACVCPIDGCNKLFHTNTRLKAHQRICHTEPRYQCLQCDRKFKSHFNLTKHRSVHITDKHFVCTVEGCQKSFKTEEYLGQHLKSFHQGAKVKCPHCYLQFDTKELVKLHTKAVHVDIKPLCCPKENCVKSFETERQLKYHIIHSHCEKVYSCLECGNMFKTAGTLHAHRAVHISERTVSCTVEGCNKMFKTKEHVRTHLLFAHRNHQCPLCDKMFKSESLVHQHQAVHVTKPFWCHMQNCNQTFKEEDEIETPRCRVQKKALSKLKVHKAVHEISQKSVVCPVEGCSKTFKTKQTLADHTSRLHGEKNHQCPDCDKRFTVPSMLKKHRDIHLLNKKVPCPVEGCNKIYKTQRSLADHKRKHHQD